MRQENLLVRLLCNNYISHKKRLENVCITIYHSLHCSKISSAILLKGNITTIVLLLLPKPYPSYVCIIFRYLPFPLLPLTNNKSIWSTDWLFPGGEGGHGVVACTPCHIYSHISINCLLSIFVYLFIIRFIFCVLFGNTFVVVAVVWTNTLRAQKSQSQSPEDFLMDSAKNSCTNHN